MLQPVRPPLTAADGSSTASGPTTSTTRLRVHTAGDREGYYADYTGTTADIAHDRRRAGSSPASARRISTARVAPTRADCRSSSSSSASRTTIRSATAPTARGCIIRWTPRSYRARQRAAAAGAADAAAVHGSGVGGVVAVPLLHRPPRRARALGDRRAPQRVRAPSPRSPTRRRASDPRSAGARTPSRAADLHWDEARDASRTPPRIGCIGGCCSCARGQAFVNRTRERCAVRRSTRTRWRSADVGDVHGDRGSPCRAPVPCRCAHRHGRHDAHHRGCRRG